MPPAWNDPHESAGVVPAVEARLVCGVTCDDVSVEDVLLVDEVEVGDDELVSAGVAVLLLADAKNGMTSIVESSSAYLI